MSRIFPYPWIYMIALASLLLILSGCTQKSANSQPKESPPDREVIRANETASPSNNDPFADMTIPSLRARTYNSTIGPLEKYQDTAPYTSYVTNYTSDGLKINGLLTKPNGDKPPGGWPAIVFVHGYIPPQQYKTTEKYVEYVNSLTRNGFVVFKIDLRGHGSSEGEAGGGYYSSDYVIDTLNAYSALQHTDFVNPQKIGLWGHSMAGNILLRSFATKPEIPAVVIWAGAGYSYQDLRDYRISDNSYQPQPSNAPTQQRRQALFNTHGQFSADDPFWKQVAPTNYLNDLKGAIQFNHAVDDAVVSINYSRNLNKLLDETKVQHELKEYPSGGHNIANPSFNQAMQNTVDFYTKFLK